MACLAELRNRGVADVCILACDGLKGLPEAVTEIWPLATVQLCVVHLVRASLRYTSKVHWGQISKALQEVYTVPIIEAAAARFCDVEAVWGERYPAVGQQPWCRSDVIEVDLPQTLAPQRGHRDAVGVDRVYVAALTGPERPRDVSTDAVAALDGPDPLSVPPGKDEHRPVAVAAHRTIL